jgi:mannose-6-phosphate isomerase-like protein (cupin superfamily)
VGSHPSFLFLLQPLIIAPDHQLPVQEDVVSLPAQSPSENAEPEDNPAPEIVHFSSLPPIACPCGTARRAFMDAAAVPYSLHLTQIEETARTHYHRRITETYLILECEPGAVMELDDRRVPLAPDMAILIPPGVRHRAVGKVKVAIVACPKFDPADEWFDD